MGEVTGAAAAEIEARSRHRLRPDGHAPRVLVLSSGLGCGHARAADAVVQALRRLAPNAVVREIDFWSLMNPGVAVSVQQIYLELVQRHPDLYERVHRLPQRTWRKIIERAVEPPDEVVELIGIILENGDVSDWVESALRRYPSDLLLYPTACATLPGNGRSRTRALPRLALLKWIWSRLERRMEQQVLAFAPDVVVSTQMVSAALVSAAKMRRGLRLPSIGVVTDFGVHDYWIQPGTDLYCIADEAMTGPPFDASTAAKVVVTGIPLMPGFSNPPTAAASRAVVGLDANVPIVLILGGGLGLGVDTVARRLLERGPHLNLVVMAGRNAEILGSLASHAANPRLLVCDWTDRMEVFLAAADLVVGKPGGLTVAEALACGRPLLATRSLRGQEGFNVAYIERNGVGRLVTEEALPATIDAWLADRQLLAAMQSTAQRLGRRHGAELVATRALEFAQRAPRELTFREG